MIIRLMSAAALLLAVPAAAFADDDNAVCTDAAKSTWLGTDAIKAKAEAAGFTKVKKVKVEGSCYEVYAFDAAGKKVEVLFNPVTGEQAKTEAGD